MKHPHLITVILIFTLCLFELGCATASTPQAAGAKPHWPGAQAIADPDRREVTVLIALSSVVPGGIIGHTGIAVDQQYWDFGPERVKRFQRFKSFNSTAGPWWDDPDQQWQTNRTLDEVLADVPNKVHPTGSLVALMRIEVTDAQANELAAFWQTTYQRMRHGDDQYSFGGRQCTSMVAWSLAPLIQDQPMTQVMTDGQLPEDLRLMTPTHLYEILCDSLRHTAGERQGQRADIELWQLKPEGLTPWHRPIVWDRLGAPKLPRIRLAIERFKYMPAALFESTHVDSQASIAP